MASASDTLVKLDELQIQPNCDFKSVLKHAQCIEEKMALFKVAQ